MNWPKRYLQAIRDGEIVACANITAVYAREVSWMDAPPSDFQFYFDEESGQRPIDFIETYCKHSKGRWAGKPFLLELFQKAKLQLVYGWREKDTGVRRFREVVDVRARKNGKSSETAAVELYALIADGEGGAEVYACANKLDQSRLVFNEAVNMRAQSDGIRGITKKRQSDIYFPATMSYLKALAADTKTMDGLNAHFFSQDEFHEARDSKLYDVMVQSQSSREQPLAWLISTNGFVREAFFDTKYSYCEKVARWEGGYEDYRLLPLLYTLDARDEWTKPDAWVKANPCLGGSKSYVMMAENVAKAKRDPSFLPTLLTKDCNQAENSNTQWLPYEACVNETVVPMEYLTNTYAIGGCDLSSTTDLTAATLLIRRPNDPNFYVLQRYFLPKARADVLEQTNVREAPYRLWAEQGWLTLCDGATVDFHAVTLWFAEMRDRYKINALWTGYDRALAGYWIEDMTGTGFALERIPQGARTWTYPMKELGGLLSEHRIVYQNNPVLRWCLLNTAAKSLNPDGIESIQPVKTSETKRIDGTVSLLNAFTCYKNHEDEYNRYLR